MAADDRSAVRPDTPVSAADGARAWADALAAAALLAVDPVALGGVALRALAGPVRDRWLAHVKALLPPQTAWHRMPLHISDDRLLGGLDLAATLRSGRPVAQAGLLAQCDGGVLIVAMAERLRAGHAAMLVGAIDRGGVRVERDGLALQASTRFAVLALDEGSSAEERLPATLADRLAFHLDLGALSVRDAQDWPADAQAIALARTALPAVQWNDDIAQALCAATLALGIASPRAAWLAWRASCVAAALRGSPHVDSDDAALAARLVLAPRATTLPAVQDPADAAADADAEPPPLPPAEPSAPPEQQADAQQPQQALDDMLVEAALSALPPGLLAALRLAPSARQQQQSGRADVWTASPRGGRPVGSRRGDTRGGARLSLIDTLRAAAPWQTLRRRARGDEPAAGTVPRIEVRADDFHVQRHRQRTATTTLFVLDASGSSALQRLGEAKGAIHLLLADCYVRRDSVAVLAFRGRSAELLLPPTRSLVRAKRSLQALPGGGGTPLAAGIEMAVALAHQVRRNGANPVLVFLTDGRANVARDGSGGRPQAEADALRAARQLRAGGFATLLIDTSPQPSPAARRLAAEMAAQYRALPHAGAQLLSQAVRGLQQPAAAAPAGAAVRAARG